MSEITLVSGQPLKTSADDQLYQSLLDVVKHNLSLFDIQDKIYFVDVEAATGKSLFDHYLGLFPEDIRQQYRCKTCERWLNKYGQYVTVDDGVVKSMAFDIDIPAEGEPHSNAYAFVQALNKVIGKCPIAGVVVDNEKNYALKHSGKFNHFEGEIQCDNASLIFTYDDEQRMGKEAQARENVRIVKAYINRWGESAVNKAAALFEHGELKHHTKFKRSFEQWHRLNKAWNATKNNNIKNNLIWEAVDFNNMDLVHFGNTVVGGLLDNLTVSSEAYAIKTFRTQTEGVNYQRATEKPNEQQLEAAKKLVVEMGIESAFQRRFATLDDIQYWFWKAPDAVEAAAEKTSIFDGMKTQEGTTQKAETKTVIDGGAITFMAFANEVLPKVKRLGIRFPNANFAPLNLTQYVAATDPESKPILRWDNEEKRNTVSTYVYNTGSRLGQWTEESVSQEFVVAGITVNPNIWDNVLMKYDIPVEGVTLLINGLKDRGNQSVALFAETLRHELRDIRRVVEEYSNTHKLDDVEGRTGAAGLAVVGNNTVDLQQACGQFTLVAYMEDGAVVTYTLSRYY